MAEDGQAVLITGAGSGIGAAAARAFSRLGSPVVIGDLAPEGVQMIEREIISDGGEVLAARLDVRDDASVRALVAAGIKRFGGYATVCANAGVFPPDAPLAEMRDEVIDELLAVNLRGVVYTLRAALPYVGDGGSMILTSSTSGLSAHAGQAVYAATKIALIGLARSLAAEVAGRRIRVNAVCPGGVDTPLLSQLYNPKEIARFAAANPLGRLAAPDDIAQTMVFLSSCAARHINGVALRVDGGEA